MLGSGLDIGPHCPNGSTQKCVMSFICIRLDQTKQTVSGCLAQFGHLRSFDSALGRTGSLVPLSYQTRPVEMYRPASAAQLRDSNLSPRQGSRGCQSTTGKLRIRVAVLAVETPPRFSEAVRILDDPGPQRDHANEQVHARVG